MGHHAHHTHDHGHEHSHDHSDTTRDRGIWSTSIGIRAVKTSLLCLAATAALQAVVVVFSESVALLADTVHNFGDAATAIPLWIAFRYATRKPTERFTYGFGRVEDIAGMIVLMLIAASAAVAAYESVMRIIHPEPIQNVVAVAAASLVGFGGNMLAAHVRIKAGREIGSAALVADGRHAQTDSYTSLAVLLGAAGVWLGFPLADPIIGALISVAIFCILVQASRDVLVRTIDGMDPEMLQRISSAAVSVAGVRHCGRVRARWSGHRIHADLSLAISEHATIAEAERIRQQVELIVRNAVPELADIIIQWQSAH
ncbi:cation transporter [Candidatus Uhrbacteria bacterium]|nr:cation transporter [Candidatus Uhrbacteria bacterium]